MESPTNLDHEYQERARILDSWVEIRRRLAALEAEATGLLIEQFDLHDRDATEFPHHRDSIYRSMIAEFSAAGHIPRASMEFAFADARSLRDWLPRVRASFDAGLISARHVREIVRASEVVREAITNKRVDAEVMDLYEAAVLVVAERDTAARTRTHAREVASSLVGETVVERHRRSTKERSVTVRSLDDGLALLTAVLPEWIAVAIQDRLTQMSHQVIAERGTREPVLDPSVMDSGEFPVHADDLDPWDPLLDELDNGDDMVIYSKDGATFTLDPSDDVEHLPSDTRCLDEIRADIFSDMLLAGSPSSAAGSGLGAVRARIQVTVSATTLAGFDDRPAQLDGHGELDPEIARSLAGWNDGWTRLFVDPSGLVVETDSYTPTTAMKRYLRARDQRCRFPGCRAPIHRCEIDHNHDHARGGRTAIENLCHFCTGHHALKHPDVPDPHRWTAQQQPDGTVTWFSPLGRSYDDPVPRRVMFV